LKEVKVQREQAIVALWTDTQNQHFKEVKRLKICLDEVKIQQKQMIAALWTDTQNQFTADIEELKSEIETLKTWTAPVLDSRIVSSFPLLFNEFHEKQFVLLWNGSCDGFGAQAFHVQCDGHATTLTLILDTSEDVLRGFMLLEWESRMWNEKRNDENDCCKCDDSLKSFIFTVNNRYGTPAKKFALKIGRKQYAIFRISSRAPVFGHGQSDFCIYKNCNANIGNYTGSFGNTYTNNTRLNGRTFFIGSEQFAVREIEVFEITDSFFQTNPALWHVIAFVTVVSVLPVRAELKAGA
jgi:hypothetical protein